MKEYNEELLSGSEQVTEKQVEKLEQEQQVESARANKQLRE